jgi:16S rRNA (adenine1518-N6/adenine1519-N6)-dimethyltransferase
MKAKKSLGQNFLKSELVLKKIIEAGEIKPNDIILEIGPGKGALTEKLLEHANLAVAVEKDYELFEFLKIKFAEQITSGSLVLVHDDILRFDINEEILKLNEKKSEEKFSQVLGSPRPARPDHSKTFPLISFKIIANIPYNITGAILKKFLSEKHQPELMVLMVQHEVATRILARDGKESILSISVKAYGEPEMITKVDKRYFSPMPKVNSAVIKISNISRRLFIENNINEEKFWEIVKTGFAHKRKKLSSNLKGLNYYQEESLINLGNKRAEDLTLIDWIALAKM